VNFYIFQQVILKSRSIQETGDGRLRQAMGRRNGLKYHRKVKKPVIAADRGVFFCLIKK
jgi:hypothetical protein